MNKYKNISIKIKVINLVHKSYQQVDKVINRFLKKVENDCYKRKNMV